MRPENFLMKKNNFLLLVLLVHFWAMSQNKNEALLYNSKGQFRPDTSLTISMDQYEIWRVTELKLYTALGHNNLANNLKKEIAKNKFNIRNVISFDCDSAGISNIVYVKKFAKTWDGDGTLEDLDRIKKNKKKIFQFFKEANKHYFPSTLQYYGGYYINL